MTPETAPRAGLMLKASTGSAQCSGCPILLDLPAGHWTFDVTASESPEELPAEEPREIP